MPVRRSFAVIMLAAGLASAPAACQDSGAPPPKTPVALRVLFIGNSLTYTNSLPGTLAGVAKTGGAVTTTRQGWMLHQEGARCAAPKTFSSTARSTGSGRNARAEYRVAIASKTSMRQGAGTHTPKLGSSG